MVRSSLRSPPVTAGCGACALARATTLWLLGVRMGPSRATSSSSARCMVGGALALCVCVCVHVALTDRVCLKTR
eukprot:1158743-Pelagomonas_calceolata.AAC.27